MLLACTVAAGKFGDNVIAVLIHTRSPRARFPGILIIRHAEPLSAQRAPGEARGLGRRAVCSGRAAGGKHYVLVLRMPC